MTAARLYRCLLAALLTGAAPAWAQLTVEPQSVGVTVEQYGAETRTVTLRNDGAEPLSFCLSFDRPLQRSGPTLRLNEQARGTACGSYGEVLYRYDEDDWEGDTGGGGWDPSSIGMTPEGRLLVAEPGGFNRTLEFTPDLELARFFEHPHVAELTP